MKTLVSVQNLVKRFGGVVAVNHCSFAVRKNSITALIGPNGAGKTTLFDLLSGILSQDSGEIHFHGKSIEKLPEYTRARMGMGRTFQAIRLFPELTVLDNVLLAFPEIPDGFFDLFRPLSKIQKQLHTRAFELLHRVNLQEKAHHKASALSYGQQKLLEIIRAVATEADLFLLDEPAAGVNRTMLHSIISLIKELHAEGKTFLIVEHDMGFVMNLSEHVIVMDYGKEIAEGTPEEIQKNPHVLEAYLGQKVQ